MIQQLALSQEFEILTQNVFDTWTPESAYLLGLFFADGHANDSCNLCSLATKDKQLATLVSELLNVSHLRTQPYPTKKGPHTLYRVEFRGEQALSLKRLGLPIGYKSASLAWPYYLPSHLTRDFIRGFFDGDGSASQNRPYISFASNSVELLLAIEYVGQSLSCYPANITYAENPYGSCHTLCYGNVVDVALWGMYMYLYPTTDACLLRKRRRVFKSLGIAKIPDTPNLHVPCPKIAKNLSGALNRPTLT